MELEDRTTIVTPEGIELSLQLAGLGSRFMAACVDLALQAALIAAVGVISLAAVGGDLGDGLFAIGSFFAFYLYNVLFEVYRGGQTPGKKAVHLRVVREQGAPVDLRSSAVRNVIRVFEGPILLYVPAMIAIVVTARNQRLGDLAAGTLVIRLPEVPDKWAPYTAGTNGAAHTRAMRPADVEGWDVSALKPDEIAAVRLFLGRRAAIQRDARRTLAHRLAENLRSRIGGAPPDLPAEALLEGVIHAKDSGGQIT